MTKGCGLKGIIRDSLSEMALSFALCYLPARKEIEAYALEKQLNWRDDASNSSLKYRRNQIRHQVIPTLREINPGFDHTITGNLRRWQESYQLYQKMVEQLKQELVRREANLTYIDANRLKEISGKDDPALRIFSIPTVLPKTVIQDILAQRKEVDGSFFLQAHRIVTTSPKLTL